MPEKQEDILDCNDPNLIFGGSNEDIIDDDEYLEFSRAPDLEFDDQPFEKNVEKEGVKLIKD